jgi:hypothetical protein
MLEILNARKLPLLATTDILVVGAGSAGCMTALAASSSKKHSVMLVERYGFPGGTSTQMLDTFYGFFTPGDSPKKVVGGLPDQVVNQLDRSGNVFLRPNTYGAGTGVNYNPERLKLVWDQMITGAGISYLLHTHLVEVSKNEGDFNSCIFWNKNGFQKVLARRVIDASGDADYCYLSEFDTELAGEHEPIQSMTTTFRMSNVNLDQYEAAGGKKMLQHKMNEMMEKGTYPLPRKEGSAHEMCQKNCISTVAVKVSNKHALKVQELTQAEIEGRKQAFIYENFFNEQVPGYQQASIIGLSHHIGVRETRRVYGEKRLTAADCMAGEIPDDSVLLCGAPIEDHRKGKDGEDETYWQYIPNSGVYGIPYGTLVPKGSTTTWVVGRCFSATHDAHASCRSMAQTMAMGQAAGLAAVISLSSDYPACELPVNLLRESLMEHGAILEPPSRVADTSRNGWTNNVN